MRFSLLLTALTLLVASPTFADNAMAGTWRGSNGIRVLIPAGSGKFQLVWESKGPRVSFPAEWVRPGQEFRWTDKQNAVHRAVLEANHKPVRIRDVGEAFPDSPGFWYRIP